MRYHYYQDENGKTICTSSYGKKIVRAVVKCDKTDQYNPELGKEIARAKVDIKVGQKRVDRATKKCKEAEAKVIQAIREVKRMNEYLQDAINQLSEYQKAYDTLCGKDEDDSR